MKLSDIDDLHVLLIAEEWKPAISGHPGVVQKLIDEGIPRKLAEAKVEQLCSKRLLEYGVSVNYPWPTPNGLAVLRDSEKPE